MTTSATPISPSDEQARLLAMAEGWLAAGRQVALATVIGAWGSAPRPVGAHLVLDDGGRFEGSVSGGCVEAAVIAAGREIIEDGAPRVLRFGVSDTQAWSVGLACGGTIEIFVERLTPATVELFKALDAQRPAALATRLADGQRRLVTLAQATADVAQAIAARRSRLAADGETFIEVRELPPRLVIVGAVHIAQNLAYMAALTGWQVSVVDPRRAYLTPERFPQATLIAAWPDEALPALGLDNRSAVIVLAHDPKIDDPALIAALQAGCLYVGALGSRRTHEKRRARLAAAGLAPAELDRIDGPVGLPIGAVGAAEIALSILAAMTLRLRADRLRPRIAAVVLAAGRSSRMGRNKLLIRIEGASLVERAVDAALESGADPVVVVLGHDAAAVAARLADRPVVLVFNPDHADGLSTSLKRGIAALPATADGALICLGDMPFVDADLLKRLIAAFDPAAGRTIALPVSGGRRGNPVLWSRDFFPEFAVLAGDRGARALLDRHAAAIVEVEAADDAPLIDVDTPAALADLGIAAAG